MPMLIMGSLALAQGVFGGIMGGQQSKAQAMQQQLQIQQQNFQAEMRTQQENRNLFRQQVEQGKKNKEIERFATEERAFSELALREQYKNSRSDLSKQTQQTNDMFLASVSARGMSSSSATVKALLRQNTANAENNMKMMRVNLGSKMRDIENQQKNRLAQRNLGYVSQKTFIPNQQIIADSSSSALMTGIASGVFGGLSAGLAADAEYGGQKNWGFGLNILGKS